jgi:hypothetical protein
LKFKENDNYIIDKENEGINIDSKENKNINIYEIEYDNKDKGFEEKHLNEFNRFNEFNEEEED